MKLPLGFRAAGIHAGIKAVRKDFALFESEVPCAVAGVFTRNTARAAPVVDATSRVPGEGFRAIAINSGNANALTGPAGVEAVEAIHAALAHVLGARREQILSASTGVIGVPLPVDKLVAAAPELVGALRASIEPAAEAMMTTDTQIKLAGRTLGGVTLAAAAKGSGMIAPQLATLIVVVTTDAAIAASVLQPIVARAARCFEMLIVDGDTSTNDAVFVMANGRAGAVDLGAFERALGEIFAELARAVAEDGEGATKTLEIEVKGAPSEAVARDMAKSIAGSPLVKAAMFGADPNYGRILATVGSRAGALGLALDPRLARVTLQGVVVFEGGPTLPDAASLRSRLRAPAIAIEVDLRAGEGSATALGCDLSYDYVKINADYSSTIVASPEGTVTRDDRLTNYSPHLKHALLVEALSYIRGFAGRRAVIAAAGAVIERPSLRASLAGDVNLLDAAGLLPIVVHAGGADEATLGATNAELVSLLNQSESRAVGISGKDGGLLRAGKVDASLVELLLGKEYVPVIAPIATGDDGRAAVLGVEGAAAAVAVALRADKLLLLVDAPGLEENGELVSEIGAADLRARASVPAAVASAVAAALTAIDGGVGRVHLVDGRVPHAAVAELFTDRGVGTLVVR
ncbi:MAG: bifunctional glutamate N-acetyltransferase/amino-acid acetyltransferase ArgJ [Myxococcales bacterium]|nr:bifunctional glutamate N-acetyltransferase/amino-acid acetyltransferase ArgJ [Myxococcales bacterium]